MAYSKCIAVDNYDITHNPKVREKYPNLYAEVKEHDTLIPRNSWYDLSDTAHEEYKDYIKDEEIGYVESR